MLRRSAALLFATLAPAVSAQVGGGVIASTSQADVHDVRSAAMGRAGAFLPDASPLSFLQNPARLAEATADPMVRVAVHGHSDYRTAFGAPLGTGVGHLAATGVAGPLAVGVAVSSLAYDVAIGIPGGDDRRVEGGDRTLAVGAATRVGGPRASLDLGATVRATRLRGGFGPDESGELQSAQTRASFDIGIAATVDVLPPAPQLATGALAPFVTVSAGYAQRMIGPAFRQESPGLVGPNGEVGPPEVYVLEQPRTGSLGLSARVGLETQRKGGRLQIARLELAAEAEAMLYTQTFGPDNQTVPERATLVGAMRPQDALLGLSGDPTVEGQRGVRLTVADALWLAAGRFEGSYADGEPYRTWGTGLSLGGALRTLGTLQDDTALTALGHRYDLTVGVARGSLTANAFGDASFTYRLVTVGASARL